MDMQVQDINALLSYLFFRINLIWDIFFFFIVLTSVDVLLPSKPKYLSFWWVNCYYASCFLNFVEPCATL